MSTSPTTSNPHDPLPAASLIRRIRDVRTKNIHQSEKHRSNCDFAILADRGCASMERGKHGSSKPKPLDLQKAVESCKLGQDQDGFCVKFIDKDIGQGVFTTRKFKPDEFLLEYAGELLSYKEASRRESSYTEVDGSFLVFFNAQNKVLCIDATFDPFELRKARFVNDGIGEEQNCRMVVVMVDKKPHLCLFSTKTIQIGDELRYDYGVPNLPWRKKKSTNQVDIEESAEADDLHVWKDSLHDAQDQVDIEESADDLWKDPLNDAQGGRRLCRVQNIRFSPVNVGHISGLYGLISAQLGRFRSYIIEGRIGGPKSPEARTGSRGVETGSWGGNQEKGVRADESRE
ncbi:hypothetical protein ScPMuIL_016601 [Solemya velum]